MIKQKHLSYFVFVTLSLVGIGIFLVFYHFAHLCPLLAKSTPVVNISTGNIQGRIGYSLRSGKPFWQFLSIPYAEAPVGKLRFQPPVPLQESWDGVKQTVVYPPMCLQYDSIGMQIVQGREDCLFLNVFVSSPSKEAITKPNRPVIIFIFGGGFQCGSTRLYYPDFFMDQDEIVLVTFDYRLGPLGFLNLAEAGDYSEENLRLPRGNMGLKDQRLLLQWVQTNIANFGGDPKKVTIFGESAGGACVHFHMASPKSQGLFEKGISFSGTAFNPWAVARNLKYQKKTSSRYASLAGCPLDDKIKLWECLSNADFTEVVKQQLVIEDPSAMEDMLVASIEVVNSDDMFFDKHPREILKADGGSKVPWILGGNSGEGALLAARFYGRPTRFRRFDENWIHKVGFNLELDPEQVPHSVAKKIREYYFKNITYNSTDPEVYLKHAVKYISDSYGYRGMHEAAVQHVINGAPTYLYHYNYTKSKNAPSIFSYFRAVNRDEWMPSRLKTALVFVYDWFIDQIYGQENGSRRFGISHGDELFQTFNLLGMTGYFSGGDKEFSNALVKTIVEFAGNDEKASLSFRGVEWPALTKADVTANNANCSVTPLPAMLMDNSKIPKVILEPYAESLEFWARLEREDNVFTGICQSFRNDTRVRVNEVL